MPSSLVLTSKRKFRLVAKKIPKKIKLRVKINKLKNSHSKIPMFCQQQQKKQTLRKIESFLKINKTKYISILKQTINKIQIKRNVLSTNSTNKILIKIIVKG